MAEEISSRHYEASICQAFDPNEDEFPVYSQETESYITTPNKQEDFECSEDCESCDPPSRRTSPFVRSEAAHANVLTGLVTLHDITIL